VFATLGANASSKPRMNSFQKTASRVLWPALAIGLVSLLAAVALLVLGQIVPAAVAGVICALCCVPVLVVDAQDADGQRMTTGSAATPPARTRYVPLP
jgi:hypothetical protein